MYANTERNQSVQIEKVERGTLRDQTNKPTNDFLLPFISGVPWLKDVFPRPQSTSAVRITILLSEDASFSTFSLVVTGWVVIVATLVVVASAAAAAAISLAICCLSKSNNDPERSRFCWS